MPARRPLHREPLEELSRAQHGAVGRRQLLKLGLTPGQIEARLSNGSWRTSGFPGVYLTITGPVPDMTRAWAALLYAGEGATLSHESAEWTWELRDEAPAVVHVTVSAERRVTPQKGLRIHYSVHIDTRRHPVRRPAVTRVEHTVLDVIDSASSALEVVDALTRACQRRRTTAPLLRAAAAQRLKMSWRRLVRDVLSDVEEGVQSPLERSYFRDVEIPHGLPRGERNRSEGVRGRRRYRDVRYRRWRVVVELDGSAAHPVDRRDRDDLRDNSLAEEEGTQTLRYGWSMTGRPCATAAQVAKVLVAHGWNGEAVPCAPGCPVGNAQHAVA